MGTGTVKHRRSVLVVRPGNPLRGEVGEGGQAGLPGDKSLSHRAALLAAMADGESQVENLLVAGVTLPLLDGLAALGVPWSLEGNCLRVQGRSLEWEAPITAEEAVHINCGNSATTLRLLAGALAAWNRHVVLDGSAGLRRRPMKRIVAPLQQMGVDIQATDGCAPLHIRPSLHPLRALDYTLPVASAQVKSCLLLAALAADGPTTLHEPGPSRDHTERMLRSMGASVESFGGSGASSASLAGVRQWSVRIEPVHALTPLRLVLPGDISAATFLIVAALITPGSEVLLRGVGLNQTRTGVLDALAQMGADLEITPQGDRHGEPVGDIRARHSALGGAQVGGDLVVRMIDEFPAFAVAAAYSRERTVVLGAEELRHKESDRISDLCQELRKLGVRITETADGFVVDGSGDLEGGVVQSHGDHRLAMALGVAGLAARSEVRVEGAEMVTESFPAFESVLQGLGGEVQAEAL
ncbi:MAG: 3-phosphoshikimate 1-carboxyvinyltransferase [Chloroflexota bacterium]